MGIISRDELAVALDLIERLAQNGPLFWLVDLTGLEGLDPNARKLLSERDARAFFRAIILVGGSFHQRVLATLAIKGVRLFWRHKTHVPFAFFGDEAEAIAWVNTERKRKTPGQA